MKWIEAKVTIEANEILFAYELVSNIFYDLDTHGLVITDQDKTLEKVGFNFNPNGQDLNALSGYFPEDEKTAQKCRVLEKKLRYLEKEFGIKSRVLYKHIDEQDWSECWKTYFWPEKISEKIVVKPSWREYRCTNDEIIVELDPGMAFGTGIHPTTRLCINMIEKYLTRGDSFLDVGTGSGILMVAAFKIGAQRVIGIDNDPIAVEVAKKNLLQNKIENHQFMVFCGNLVEALREKFNLVAANILTETILDLLDHIKKALKKDGYIIVSGIIAARKDPVVKKMKALGFEILDTRTKANWVAITGRLN